jgi:chromosome segregation ATPase
MKKMNFFLAICCALALVTFVKISSAQSEITDLTALKQHLGTELKSLRTELLQQSIEFQEYKIKQLERELQRLKTERDQLDETEMKIRRQLTQVEQSIAAGSSDEQEGMKAELNGPLLESVRRKTQPLGEQETELLKQLAHEQNQLQSLQTKLKQLNSKQGIESRH